MAQWRSAQASRYSPALCTGIDKRVVTGDPDPCEISTSYVERQNLTSAHGHAPPHAPDQRLPSVVENLAHAVSLHYMHYNFARLHQSLTITNDDGTRTKRTPAMAAGVADHAWTLREVAALLESN